jgi:hypothetical protein
MKPRDVHTKEGAKPEVSFQAAKPQRKSLDWRRNGFRRVDPKVIVHDIVGAQNR